MKKTILYIDGENLRHYIEKVLKQGSVPVKRAKILNVNLKDLFNKVLKGIRVSKKVYYASRLRFHKNFPEKSNSLIQEQRVLKSKLEKNGFQFLISGNVRGQKVKINGKTKIVFREKGVDVRMAVDIVVAACDRKVQRIVLCSSDSDLQPAVKEAKERGVEVVYLGFETNPNKGLIYTTNRTILIRDSEILENFSK